MYEDERQDQENLTPDLLKGHIEYLSDMCSQGIIIQCGPLKINGFMCGRALLIFKATSQEEVEDFVSKDPFIAQKWYASYHIYEWIEANVSNDYLIS